MTTIATLAVKLIADAGGFMATMDQAEKKSQTWSQNVSRNLKDVGGKMTDFGQNMTARVTLPILAASTAAVKFASDLEETKSKVKVVFGSMSQDVLDWSITSATAMGMSREQALAAAGTYGNLFVSLGLGQKPAADMSMNLVQLASDLASFNNANPQEVLDALRSGLSGEIEPLKKYGVAMNEAILKQKAMEMGLGDNIQALTEAEKLQLRYAIIMEQTATAQGDFARTSDGLANQTRIVNAQFIDAAATLGEKLLPYGLTLIQWVSQAITWFQQLTPEQQKWIMVILGIVAVMGPLIMIIGSLITAIGVIIPVVTAVAGALSGVALPILLIIGLLALLYFAWTNNWFGIQEKTRAVIDFIKGVIASGMQFIQDLTSGKLGWLSQVWQNAMDSIQAIIESALAIWRHIKQAWRNIENGNWYMFGVEMRKIWDIAMRLLETLIRNAWENIKLVFQNVIKKIIDYFKNIDWAQVGKNIIEGIINGLFWAAVKLDAAIRKISQNAKDAIQGFFGIHSESKVMKYQVGWEMGAGVASGWEESINKLLMPQMGPGMIPEPVGAVAGLGSVRGAGQPVSIVLDYHPLISTADENEARFVLAPLIQDEIRKRAKQA